MIEFHRSSYKCAENMGDGGGGGKSSMCVCVCVWGGGGGRPGSRKKLKCYRESWAGKHEILRVQSPALASPAPMPPSPFKVTHLEVSGETPHGGSNLRLGGPAVQRPRDGRSWCLAEEGRLARGRAGPIEEGLSGRSEPLRSTDATQDFSRRRRGRRRNLSCRIACIGIRGGREREEGPPGMAVESV